MRARVAAVEGTLVHGMPTAFAGCRENVGLGRSVFVRMGLFPCVRMHRRQRVSSGTRGGERRQRAPGARTRHGRREKARSSVVRGHVLRSVQRPVHVNRHFNSSVARRAGWRGRWGIAVGQTCESRRNRHRGLIGRTNARLTARHRSSRQTEEVVRDALKQEDGRGHRPCS